MTELQAAQAVSGADNEKAKKGLFKRLKGSFSQTKIPPKEWKSFTAGTFKIEDNTGITLNAAGRPEHMHQPADTREKISEPVHESYSRFLSGHVSKLIELQNSEPETFHQILNLPEHQYEKKLIERLTDEVIDPSGKTLNLNKAKLTAFLKSSAGLEATTMLLEQQSSYQMFALGLTNALDPKGFRQFNLNERPKGLFGLQANTLGIDQGPLANLIDRYVMPYLEVTLPDVAGRKGKILGKDKQVARGWVLAYLSGQTAAGAALGFLLCGPAGAAVGGAATPALVGLRELLKSGLSYDTKFTAAALESVKGTAAVPNPHYDQEKEYIRRLYGINMDDFQVNGTRVELVPGRTHQTTNTLEQIKADALGKLFTRLMFYESIGVPSKVLDMLPEQFVYRPDGGLPEKLGTKMQQELVQALNLNGAAWLGMTPEERLAKIRQVRGELIVKRLEAELSHQRILAEHGQAVSNLQGQLNRRENSSALIIGERTKAHTDRKAELEVRKTELTGRSERTNTQPSQEKEAARKTAEDEVTQLEKRLKTLFIASGIDPVVDLALAANPTPAEAQIYLDNIDKAIGEIGKRDPATGAINGGNGLELALQQLAGQRFDMAMAIAKPSIDSITESVKDEIETIDDILSDPTVDNKYRDSKAKEKAALLARRENAIKSILEKALTDADAEIIRRRDEINSQIQELKDAKGTLEAKGKEYKQAKQEEDSAIAAELKAIPIELSQNRAAFEALTITGHPLQITPEQLRNWSVQDIYSYIIATRPPYGMIPVPVTDASILELRNAIVRAKSEALVEEENQWEPSSATQQQALLDITRRTTINDQGAILNWLGNVLDPATMNNVSVTENELITQSDNQLLYKITKFYQPAGIFAGPPPLAPAQLTATIQMARTEARKRLMIADRVYVQESIKDNDYLIEALDKAIEIEKKVAGVDFDKEKQYITAVKTMVDRQGQIFAASQEIVQNRTAFTDTAAVTAADVGYTQAEKNTGYPKGYLALMQTLFGYQDDIATATRESRFTELSQIYTPQDLAMLLESYIFNGGLVAGGFAVNINNALAVLNGQIAAGALNALMLQQGFRDIINNSVSAANSLG